MRKNKYNDKREYIGADTWDGIECVTSDDWKSIQIYPVSVDYDINCDKLLKSLNIKFHTDDSLMRSKISDYSIQNRYDGLSGKVDLNMTLGSFDSSDSDYPQPSRMYMSMLEEYYKEHEEHTSEKYRSATLVELLAFAKTYPDLMSFPNFERVSSPYSGDNFFKIFQNGTRLDTKMVNTGHRYGISFMFHTCLMYSYHVNENKEITSSTLRMDVSDETIELFGRDCFYKYLLVKLD